MHNASLEDHFWHLACLSRFYKEHNDSYYEKMCLKTLCDMNYAFAAMLYFDKEKVLPRRYKQYLIPFEHAMKDDLLEERIKFYNKKDQKKNIKKYALYALTSLISIPLMLLLVFVFKVKTEIAMIISIVAIFGLDMLGRPLIDQMEKNKEIKLANARGEDKRLDNYLKYYDRFALLFQNKLYVDLISVKKEDTKQEIIKKIKESVKDID